VPLRTELPGVGRNLQDRYEVAVTHRMRKPWQVLAGARFERGDALWRLWNASRDGMYASSGAALGLIRKSDPRLPEPDIFCMALPARFEGYFPGFSSLIRDHDDRLTWAVLKAHTHNRAGTVRLASADPRAMPRIDFNCFDAGDDPDGADLHAVVQTIAFVRRLCAPLIEQGVIAEEILPGPACRASRRCATMCATPPGAITRRVRARSGRRPTAACSAATSRCTARAGCASSTPRYSRASRASSSRARSTSSPRRRPTRSCDRRTGMRRTDSQYCNPEVEGQSEIDGFARRARRKPQQ